MFLKMAAGALGRQKSKHVLIAFTVGLGVSLATAMLGVMFDVGDKVNQELKTYGANLTVIPRGSSLAGEKYEFAGEAGGGEGAAAADGENYIREDELYKIKMIFWAYNIVDFAPFVNARVETPAGPAVLSGTWFNRHLELPTGDEVDTGMMPLKSWWTLEGSPGDDSVPEGVMVGKDLAARLDVKPGSSFAVDTEKAGRKALRVRGVFESGGEEDGWIIGTTALAQEAAGLPGLVQKVEVSALTTPENDLARRAAMNPDGLSRAEWDTWYCTAYISSIAYQIEEIIPGVRVKPVMRVAESEGAILEKTQLMIILLTLLTLFCSALAISNLVTANIMERSVEIGLMKALGAGNAAVSLLVLSEMLAVAFAGGAAGYLCGLGLAQFIGKAVFGQLVAVKTAVIPLACLMILGVTLLGSLPALRAILRLKPTEVLHGR
ncbi:MAG: ABC transporter permease [Deltaproteobacteria bacterium]|jgi:putative ABC transport system permease protein|nr:ABC transporter permease [Deltaproteobacteria bacterium]